MKRLILLASATCLSIALEAQIPVQRTMAMVEKSTATWCGPCGDWGWTLQEELIADNMVSAQPNAIVMELHGTQGELHNSTADSMIRIWETSSVPNWAVNNVNRTVQNSSGIYPTITRSDIKKAVDSLVLLSPVASTGQTWSVTGNTLNVATRTKFWKAANGTYLTAAYIVEDSVFELQSGRTLPMSHHRYVLRGRVNAGVFGDQIVNGPVAANAVFDKKYSFTITPSDWVKSKLQIVTVIWKKNGTDWNSYEVVNVNNLRSSPNGIPTVEAVDQLLVYPNPARGSLNFSGVMPGSESAALRIFNALGQELRYQELRAPQGQLSEQLDISALTPGMYLLQIRTASGISTRKFTVRP